MLARLDWLVQKFGKLQSNNVIIFWFMFRNDDSHSYSDINKAYKIQTVGPVQVGIARYFYYLHSEKLLSLRSLATELNLWYNDLKLFKRCFNNSTLSFVIDIYIYNTTSCRRYQTNHSNTFHYNIGFFPLAQRPYQSGYKTYHD